jgi:hypothetical protein
MWPKLLLELFPHVARLVPMADKYLSGRGAQDKAHAAALVLLGEEMRAGLGQAGEANTALLQTLKEQGEQITEVGVEATRARMGVEAVEERVAKLERSATTAVRVGFAALVLLVGVVVLLAVVLVRLKVR